MFCIIDRENFFTPVKSGFKTSAKANDWAKKNLPKETVHLWGEKIDWYNKPFRYFVMQKK